MRRTTDEVEGADGGGAGRMRMVDDEEEGG